MSSLNEQFSPLERLDNELKHQVVNWRYFPVVKALQAMRAIKLTVAAGMILNWVTLIGSTTQENSS